MMMVVVLMVGTIPYPVVLRLDRFGYMFRKNL